MMRLLHKVFASHSHRRPMQRMARRLTVEALEIREVLNAAFLATGMTATLAPDLSLNPAFSQTTGLVVAPAVQDGSQFHGDLTTFPRRRRYSTATPGRRTPFTSTSQATP